MPHARRPGDALASTLSQEPLRLRSASLGAVQLILRQQFRIVRDERSSFHVSTEAYFYRLDDAEKPFIQHRRWHARGPDAG